MYLIVIAPTCLQYMIAALRANACLTDVLLCYIITFPFWLQFVYISTTGLFAPSNTTLTVGASLGFVANMIAGCLMF